VLDCAEVMQSFLKRVRVAYLSLVLGLRFVLGIGVGVRVKVLG